MCSTTFKNQLNLPIPCVYVSRHHHHFLLFDSQIFLSPSQLGSSWAVIGRHVDTVSMPSSSPPPPPAVSVCCHWSEMCDSGPQWPVLHWERRQADLWWGDNDPEKTRESGSTGLSEVFESFFARPVEYFLVPPRGEKGIRMQHRFRRSGLSREKRRKKNMTETRALYSFELSPGRPLVFSQPQSSAASRPSLPRFPHRFPVISIETRPFGAFECVCFGLKCTPSRGAFPSSVDDSVLCALYRTCEGETERIHSRDTYFPFSFA